MRKIITIPVIALIVTILLISGSALGIWYHIVDVVEAQNCMNEDDAEGSPDGDHATLGDYPYAGYIVLDLGSGNEMGASQEFTVFASSSWPEEYDVRVSTLPGPNTGTWRGTDFDTANHNFTTPGTGGGWRYVILDFHSGDVGKPGDPYYGPEIDAVGWYDP